jgi:hypothetical protein
MAKDPAHFTQIEDGVFMPTGFALSHWGDDHLNGHQCHCGGEGLAIRTGRDGR